LVATFFDVPRRGGGRGGQAQPEKDGGPGTAIDDTGEVELTEVLRFAEPAEAAVRRPAGSVRGRGFHRLRPQ
jgi:hypothetical protein